MGFVRLSARRSTTAFGLVGKKKGAWSAPDGNVRYQLVARLGSSSCGSILAD